jgi:hypothetical protein
MRRTVFVLVALLALLGGMPVQSSDKKQPLGVGQDLPGSFHPYNVNGPSKGRYHCPVTEYGLDPAVMLVTRDLVGNAAFKDLLKKIDAAITNNPSVRLHGFVAVLTEDLPKVVEEDDKREEVARRYEKLAEELALKNVVLCLASKADLEKYGLQENNALTVVLYHKYKILASQAVGRDKVDEAMVKKVMADIAAKLGAKR